MNTAHEIAAHIIETAKEGVKVKPEELEPAEEAAAPVWLTINLKDHFLRYCTGRWQDQNVLARVTLVLLHGQVATAWTKSVNPSRIIVVSDAVAKDDLRKKLIEQAAPPGVKANVIPVEKNDRSVKRPSFW